MSVLMKRIETNRREGVFADLSVKVTEKFCEAATDGKDVTVRSPRKGADGGSGQSFSILCPPLLIGTAVIHPVAYAGTGGAAAPLEIIYV